MFTLILTVFLLGLGGPEAASIHAVPGFATLEQCQEAGRQAQADLVEPPQELRWTCVRQAKPAERQ